MPTNAPTKSQANKRISLEGISHAAEIAAPSPTYLPKNLLKTSNTLPNMPEKGNP